MGTLHVVATPIGNLEDVTPRALRVLREARVLYAEDTRRTQILLDRFDIARRAVSLHEHNEASRVDAVLEALGRDETVALVSDAGVPLISDPGARVVAAAIEAGHVVEPVPGASAVLSALIVAGFPAAPFTFLGFLPRTAGAREVMLESYRARPETIVMFESPARLHGRLLELAACFPARRGCVARELTKRHEEVVRGSCAELAAHFADGVKGECTIVLEGALGEAAEREAEQRGDAGILDDEALDSAIREALTEGKRPREIVAALSGRTALPRKRVYARVQALKDEVST
ncbi:MAG: 16S rRNA (cytidine(1402)-2'-O)-methyltransferase [Myxococcota bacterium]|jgi:16S rRNA (cytidine1402-2'-O)-methyltransferase|nr:16S rRNA (cytidine(1402)-2'-O)-methyltransferase [Myxococcota bacterium]